MSEMDPSMPGMQPNHGSTTPLPATTQSAVIYTCPMHPEVLSDKPGSCPKCGMRLVVKKD